MNQQTFKEWKKANPEGTVEEWLDLHTDKRKAKIRKHTYPKDNISGLYAGKKRF